MVDELIPIPNYEGLYSITRKGKIFSHTCNTFLRLVKPYGHPMVCLYRDGHGMMYSVKHLLEMTKED